MICMDCREGGHESCINGAWLIGTRCDCQHRIINKEPEQETSQKASKII